MILIKAGRKPKITREMVIDAAFEVAREQGAENIFARTVAEKLGCSTQPVMFHFKTIEELKRAVYQKADEFHTGYIMKFSTSDPMLEIGLNYIRFGAGEPNLFRFLFQSNEFSGKTIADLISAEEALPLLNILSQSANCDIEQAKQIFAALAVYVHGYASLLANNSMEYDEKECEKALQNIFSALLKTIK